MATRFNSARILCAITLCGLASLASAELTKPVYDAAQDELKTIYKGARDACDKMSGNAKDVCVERAKGEEKIGMAHLKYQHTGAMKDRNDYLESRFEARYKIAKEACDDKAGNAKDVCRADAKAAHDKAGADLKANKAVTEARGDAMDTKLKADYKAASERCDALSGNPKDSCQASAKARFYQ